MNGMKRIWILLLVCVFLIGGSVLLADLADEQDEESLVGIPSAVKVSPKRGGDFDSFGVFYNPYIDRYVVFLAEYVGTKKILYSRLFNRKGKPASGFQKILEAHQADIAFIDVAYNQQDNVFFMVGCDGDFDHIGGILCNGEGLWLNPDEEGMTIKKSTGLATGFLPQVTWIPATNQYAVNWGSINFRRHEELRNGQYLSVLNSDLSFAVTKRKVRAQTMRNDYYYASILPIEDKLLWTSAEDGTGEKIQPVVWFTNLKGKILPQYGNEGNGLTYPHSAVEGEGQVHAAYNDVEDIIFLYWEQSDGFYIDEQTYRENRFRLMDSNGEFKGPWMIAPRKYPFQKSGAVHYNPVENRFFWMVPEHKTLFSANPYRSNIRGKLWGSYVGNEGDFESKSGKQRWNPVALTRYFSGTNTAMWYYGYAYNDLTNEYFILYALHDYKTGDYEFWGILYK